MGNCCCSCCKCCCSLCWKEEPKPNKHRRVTSLYDYHSRALKDLKLNKGDILEVIEESQHWLYVRKCTVKNDKLEKIIEEEEGYVPKDFVKPLDSLEAKPWYFENVTKRIEAKRCLLRPENNEGAYLVWRSAENNCFYLSVKNGPYARHYRIIEGEAGKQFFLVSHKTFSTVSDLMDHYIKKQDGLCTHLTIPCVMLDRPSLPTLSYDAKWEVDRSSLTKVEKLGSGEFAEVWHGVWNNNIDVAIKEFRVISPEIQTEIKIMKEYRHERLLKLYGVCTVSEPFCLITELMRNGSLKKYLIRHSVRRDIAFFLMIDFAVQVTEGMAYLESKNIVHRDLRADNILLTEMQFCKIADFGLAEFNLPGDRESSSAVKVPIKWMAPEIFDDKVYTSKCDVWSFGILLTEIITYGGDPYPDKDKLACIQAIRRGYRMEQPQDCPSGLYDIMKLCWRTNPEERPGFTALQNLLMRLVSEPVSELE